MTGGEGTIGIFWAHLPPGKTTGAQESIKFARGKSASYTPGPGVLETICYRLHLAHEDQVSQGKVSTGFEDPIYFCEGLFLLRYQIERSIGNS
jgi:hypothetical protein